MNANTIGAELINKTRKRRTTVEKVVKKQWKELMKSEETEEGKPNGLARHRPVITSCTCWAVWGEKNKGKWKSISEEWGTNGLKQTSPVFFYLFLIVSTPFNKYKIQTSSVFINNDRKKKIIKFVLNLKQKMDQPKQGSDEINRRWR